MIKANELRIGNWVNTVSGYQQIKSIATDACHTVALHTYEFVNPIPLSKEVLERCGFTRNSNWWGDGVDYYHKHTNEHHDITSIDIMFGFESDEGFLNCVNYGQTNFEHIKYLHELQNLYYALTKTELEYKP